MIGAEPGNAREMYNIVIQTLSRTYVAGGDIHPEEMDVIRPVMDEAVSYTHLDVYKRQV